MNANFPKNQVPEEDCKFWDQIPEEEYQIYQKGKYQISLEECKFCEVLVCTAGMEHLRSI